LHSLKFRFKCCVRTAFTFFGSRIFALVRYVLHRAVILRLLWQSRFVYAEVGWWLPLWFVHFTLHPFCIFVNYHCLSPLLNNLSNFSLNLRFPYFHSSISTSYFPDAFLFFSVFFFSFL
jgi:hypothetical protein